MAITVARTSKLDNVINVDSLHGVTFTNENQGHQFEITCTQGGEEVALTGSISARFLRANQTTVLLTGGIVNGHAVVSLLQDCYNVPGRFQLAVFNTVDSKTTCIYAAVGTVQRTQAGDLIDSGSAVPTLDELLAQIEACKTATSEADAAATKSLRYDSVQVLSDAQKMVARANADVPGVSDLQNAIAELHKVNLFGYLRSFPYTNGGLTVTQQTDGSLLFNGTVSTVTEVAFVTKGSKRKLVDGVYVLSGLPNSISSNCYLYFRYYLTGVETKEYIVNARAETPVVANISGATENAIYWTGIHIDAGVVFNNVVISPMLERGVYTGFVAPYDIGTIADDSAALSNLIPVKLIRNYSRVTNGITAVGRNDGSIVLNGTATIDFSLAIISTANAVSIPGCSSYTVDCLDDGDDTCRFYLNIRAYEGNNYTQFNVSQYDKPVHIYDNLPDLPTVMYFGIAISKEKTFYNKVIHPVLVKGSYLPNQLSKLQTEEEAAELDRLRYVFRPENIIGTPRNKQISGLTVLVNENGSVLINGTATKNTSIAITAMSERKKLSNGVYTLSGLAGGSSDKCYLYFRYKLSSDDDAVAINVRQYGAPATVEITEATDTAFYWTGIYVAKNISLDNFVVWPMLELGEIHTVFVKPEKAYEINNALTPVINAEYIKLSSAAKQAFARWSVQHAFSATDDGYEFTPEESYFGIPYNANLHYEGRDVFINRTIETFLTAMKNPASVMYQQNGFSRPVYGGMCSSFTSWLYSQDIFRHTKELGGDELTYDDAYLTLYDYNGIQSIEIGDVIIMRSGDTGHIQVVEGLEIDITTGEIKYIRLIDETHPTLRRQCVSIDAFDKLMYPRGEYRLGRYPGTGIKETKRLDYSNDIITEWGNNTYFNVGEDVWCYLANGLNEITIKNVETGIEKTAASFPTKSVTIDSVTYTLYNISSYMSDVAEYYVTVNSGKSPCKLLRINKGVFEFDKSARKLKINEYSDNAVPIWAYIYGVTADGTRKRLSHDYLNDAQLDMSIAFNGEYAYCKAIVYYSTKYGQAINETEEFSIL